MSKMFKENILLYGEGGCITGDAFIRYDIYTKDDKKQNDKGGTLQDLYAEFNKMPRKGKGCYQRKVFEACAFYVNSFDETTNAVVRNKIVNVVYSGVKDVFKLILTNGKSLKLTEDHEVWTTRGYIAVKNLCDADEVYFNPNRLIDNSMSARNVFLESVTIKSIEYYGKECTYDIICEEPYRNFIANEIAVHNSGKSSSIATLFKLLPEFPDLKVRYLMTESNAMSGLASGIKRLKLELKPEQLAYMVCRPNPVTTVSSAQIAKEYEDNFLKLSENEALKVRIEAGDRAKRTAFVTILKGMATFKGTCYVTKEVKDYGDYLKWDSDTVFVVDSLTSCVDYLVNEVKANRIATVQSDYNIVQTNLMNKIIIPLTEQSSCSIIMLGHPVIGEDQTVRQPKNEEDKVMKLYPKTFGQALNNTIVSKFSETIFTYVDRFDEFYWAGKKEGVATSPRKIPRKDKLAPDFSIYNLFKEDF